MEFNVDKCFAMMVGRQRGRSRIDPPMYILHGQVLCITDTTNYLGQTITSSIRALEKEPQDSFKSCEDTIL